MKFLRFIPAVLGLVLWGCANQGLPPGGPEDKTAPLILRTFPPANATQVPRDTRIEVEFSEKVDPRSLLNGVFISPNPGEEVEIKASGDKVRVTFPDSLLAAVTYTITLGTAIKDLRGNPLTESYTLGFSTGDEIDSKEIHGQVFAERPGQVTVWGYIVEEGPIDPSKDRATYITQCNAQGIFKFNNLAPRRYRLFALRDSNRDQRYNKGSEEIGVLPADVDLRDSLTFVGDRLFRMTLEDTTATQILSLDQPDNRHIRVRFSKPVRLGSSGPAAVQLFRAGGQEVAIDDFFQDAENQSLWHLTTAPRDSVLHELRLVGLENSGEQVTLDTLLHEFKSVFDQDSLAPRIAATAPGDSSRVLGLRQPLRITFSESMDTSQTDSLYSLVQDSAAAVSSITQWIGRHVLEVRPDGAWPGSSWLQLILDSTRVRDVAGNRVHPDRLSFAWKVINPDTLSSISGTITDPDTTAAGPVILELRQGGAQEPFLTVEAVDSLQYSFDDILPGYYLLSGFRDQDQNRRYSFGSPYPFAAAERFFVGQDTIVVRAKWPNEGNDYELKPR